MASCVASLPNGWGESKATSAAVKFKTTSAPLPIRQLKQFGLMLNQFSRTISSAPMVLTNDLVGIDQTYLAKKALRAFLL